MVYTYCTFPTSSPHIDHTEYNTYLPYPEKFYKTKLMQFLKSHYCFTKLYVIVPVCNAGASGFSLKRERLAASTATSRKQSS